MTTLVLEDLFMTTMPKMDVKVQMPMLAISYQLHTLQIMLRITVGTLGLEGFFITTVPKMDVKVQILVS